MYCALLRGINVGGKNKIFMKELKLAFENEGFTSVKTYINSGNVIFDSTIEQSKLQVMIETLIKNSFNLDIPVYVISYETLKNALDHKPEWWDKEKTEYYHHALFLFDTISIDDVRKEIGIIKADYENISFQNQIIFHSGLKDHIQKTSYSKISASTLFPFVTIRNLNTILKLLELMETKAS